MEDRCSHRATPLSLGEVTEKGLQCGYHGLTFNGDGDCVFIPGQDSIPPQACVRAYPVIERQGIVWLWTGDPAQIENSTLIDWPWNDDYENWPVRYGRMHLKCNYMLVMENLMDLTHIPYIHRKTIGGGNQMGQVNAEMKTKRTDTGVHYIRWMDGIQPPPTYVKAAGFADGVLVDRWQEFEYVAPITVLQWTGALESGRGARKNRAQDGGFSLRIYHGATPETETSCHYYFAINNGCMARSEADNDKLFQEIWDTFPGRHRFRRTAAGLPGGRSRAPVGRHQARQRAHPGPPQDRTDGRGRERRGGGGRVEEAQPPDLRRSRPSIRPFDRLRTGCWRAYSG